MKAVGIKVLKNHLSRYLNMVREGETVYVSDRDEVIAEIHKPTTRFVRGISRWEAFLNDLERRGGIIRASRRESRVVEDRKKLSPWPRNIPDILDETREDR